MVIAYSREFIIRGVSMWSVKKIILWELLNSLILYYHEWLRYMTLIALSINGSPSYVLGWEGDRQLGSFL